MKKIFLVLALIVVMFSACIGSVNSANAENWVAPPFIGKGASGVFDFDSIVRTPGGFTIILRIVPSGKDAQFIISDVLYSFDCTGRRYRFDGANLTLLDGSKTRESADPTWNNAKSETNAGWVLNKLCN